MSAGPVRWYAFFCGVFLLLQGAGTLAARLIPALDQAFPALLATTRMQPLHSLVHIATAVLAFAALRTGARATWWFALAFGSFYAALGVIGLLSQHPLGLSLQPFDHPFHILLGALGLAAGYFARDVVGSAAR